VKYVWKSGLNSTAWKTVRRRILFATVKMIRFSSKQGVSLATGDRQRSYGAGRSSRAICSPSVVLWQLLDHILNYTALCADGKPRIFHRHSGNYLFRL
jgi:hypothetical protein